MFSISLSPLSLQRVQKQGINGFNGMKEAKTTENLNKAALSTDCGPKPMKRVTNVPSKMAEVMAARPNEKYSQD